MYMYYMYVLQIMHYVVESTSAKNGSDNRTV